MSYLIDIGVTTYSKIRDGFHEGGSTRGSVWDSGGCVLWPAPSMESDCTEGESLLPSPDPTEMGVMG